MAPILSYKFWNDVGGTNPIMVGGWCFKKEQATHRFIKISPMTWLMATLGAYRSLVDVCKQEISYA